MSEAQAIARALRTTRFGRPIQIFDRVTSTNDVAETLAAQGAAEGTTVLAWEQSAGQGRLGRSWLSPRGGLWLSIVLHPTLPVEQWPLIGFAAAAGTAAAVEAVSRAAVRLKWPNDLLLGDRKLGGILIAAANDCAIVGIGLNVNVSLDAFPSDVSPAVISLLGALGHPVDLPVLAAAVLSEVERQYDLLARDIPAVMRGWRDRAAMLGRRVRVMGTEVFEGIAENVDDQGALLVRTPSGVRRIIVGDVSVREPEVRQG